MVTRPYCICVSKKKTQPKEDEPKQDQSKCQPERTRSTLHNFTSSVTRIAWHRIACYNPLSLNFGVWSLNTSGSSSSRHQVSVSSVSRHLSPYAQGLPFSEVNLNLCVVTTFFGSVWLVDEKSVPNLVNSHAALYLYYFSVPIILLYCSQPSTNLNLPYSQHWIRFRLMPLLNLGFRLVLISLIRLQGPVLISLVIVYCSPFLVLTDQDQYLRILVSHLAPETQRSLQRGTVNFIPDVNYLAEQPPLLHFSGYAFDSVADVLFAFLLVLLL